MSVPWHRLLVTGFQLRRGPGSIPGRHGGIYSGRNGIGTGILWELLFLVPVLLGPNRSSEADSLVQSAAYLRRELSCAPHKETKKKKKSDENISQH